MSCRQARNYVVSLLRDRNSEIILGMGLGLEPNAEAFPIGVREDMEGQKGSVVSYCDWMVLDGSPGRCFPAPLFFTAF